MKSKILVQVFIFLFSFSVSAFQTDSIVAVSGKLQITMKEFSSSYYEFMKKPNMKDSKKQREEFLDDLITSRIIADEARKSGLDTVEQTAYRVNGFRKKITREVHYDKVIKPKIKYTEDDVEEAYLFTQEKRRVSHLFFKDSADANSAYNKLMNGFPFSEMAKITFEDTTLANNGGDLGLLDWDQMEYDLAQTAFRAKLNEISKPVKSLFGYHIIKVTGYEKRPLITRQEYYNRRKKTGYLLESKIGEKLATEMIDSLFEQNKIKVYPEAMYFAKTEINKKIYPASDDKKNQELKLDNEELKTLEQSMWERRHDPIAEIEGKPFTIGEFLQAILFMKKSTFQEGFKKAFDEVLRDELIYRDAVRLGISEDQEIKMKTDLFEDFLLQSEVKQMLMKDISASDEEITDYTVKQGIDKNNPGFDAIKGFNKNLVLANKRANKIDNYLKILTHGEPVKTYPQIIHNYYNAIYKDLPGQSK